MSNSIELLSRPVNFAVVQLAERRSPGVLLQGDTLHGVTRQIGEMLRLLSAGKLDDLAVELEDMQEQFSEALAHYEKVCSDHRIDLPYVKS